MFSACFQHSACCTLRGRGCQFCHVKMPEKLQLKVWPILLSPWMIFWCLGSVRVELGCDSDCRLPVNSMRAIPTQLLALAGQVLKANHVDRGKSKKAKGTLSWYMHVCCKHRSASPLYFVFPMAPSLITGPSSVISVADVLGKSKSSSTMMQGCSPKVGLPAQSNDPWPERFSPAKRYSHSLLGDSNWQSGEARMSWSG